MEARSRKEEPEWLSVNLPAPGFPVTGISNVVEMSAMPSERYACFKCGTTSELKDRMARNAVCLECGADLHCCLNCRHHNAHAHNECNENQAEWVRDKDRANYCDYFEPKRGTGPAGKAPSGEDARARFDSLFKK